MMYSTELRGDCVPETTLFNSRSLFPLNEESRAAKAEYV